MTKVCDQLTAFLKWGWPLPNPIQEPAQKFFEACETGKGWAACEQFCTADATFECDVLPMKTLKEYTDWVQVL